MLCSSWPLSKSKSSSRSSNSSLSNSLMSVISLRLSSCNCWLFWATASLQRQLSSPQRKKLLSMLSNWTQIYRTCSLLASSLSLRHAYEPCRVRLIEPCWALMLALLRPRKARSSLLKRKMPIKMAKKWMSSALIKSLLDSSNLSYLNKIQSMSMN